MSREDLGRAAHQAMVRYFDGKSLILTKDDYTWEGLDEETRELYRCEADGVLEAFKQGRMSETTHDGKLDQDGKVYVHLNDDVPFDDGCVHIANSYDGGISLFADEALSLLDWLEQHKTRLEQLAKEQQS